MTDITLNVQSRPTTGKQAAALRQAGQLPAVVYGHGFTPQTIVVDYHQFEKIYQTAGESTLLDLKIDQAGPIKVLIQDIQRDPLTNQYIHVDFHQVRMDEKIKANIVLKLVGEPPAVKEIGGILVTTMNELSIECLPTDLVHEIEVDLSSLKAFDDAIHVSDLKVPKGITILDPADEVIALIQEPRSEKEYETPAPVEAAAPQVVGEAAPAAGSAEPKAE